MTIDENGKKLDGRDVRPAGRPWALNKKNYHRRRVRSIVHGHVFMKPLYTRVLITGTSAAARRDNISRKSGGARVHFPRAPGFLSLPEKKVGELVEIYLGGEGFPVGLLLLPEK